MPSDLPSPEACRATLAAFWDRAAANDTDGLLALFAPQAVSHDPVGTPPITTPDGHRALFDTVGGQFRTITFHPEIVHEAPPYVAVRWQAEAVLLSGQCAQFGGFDVFEFAADGRIVTHWGFWNPDDADA